MPLLRLANDRRFIFKMKTSDEVVNNSIVLQNDDDLWWNTVQDTSYMFFLHLWVNSPATADIRIQITEANAYGEFFRYDASGHGITAINATAGQATSGSPQLMLFHGLLMQAVANGTVHLQWAQNVAQVADTFVSVGSSLLVIRL